MALYEYKVVPAPARGEKVKGVKAPEARFAHTVEGLLNMMALDGWEFVRSEMLPSEERSGLSRTTKEWRNLLIFRREKPEATAEPEVEKDAEAPVDPRAARARVTAEPAPAARVRTPPVTAREPETRGRALARQVRGPAEEDTPADAGDEPFEIRSVDEAAEASPFRNWRERS